MTVTKEQLDAARKAAALILPLTAPQAWVMLQLAEAAAGSAVEIGKVMTDRPGYVGQPKGKHDGTLHRKMGYPMRWRLESLGLIDNQGHLTDRGRRVQIKLKSSLP